MLEHLGNGQLDNETFAKYYPTYQYERNLILGSVVGKLVKNWNKNGKILIPGYGKGGTMLNLWSGGFNNYFGVDLNLSALRKGRVENCLLQADIKRMPFPEGTFDYAVVEDVCQDFESFDVLVDGLKSIAEVVKKKGQILLVNPTAESYLIETKRFDCARFPENIKAVKLGMGREVKGTFKTTDRKGEKLEIEFVDYVWKDRDLEKAFNKIGLKIIAKKRPTAHDDKNLPIWIGIHDWISETKTPPWVVYLLEIKA